MKLHAHKGAYAVPDTLVGAIIGIDKPGFEILWQFTDSKAMILRCNIAALSSRHQTGLILTPVTKFEFVGITTSSKCQQLMAHTDTHGGDFAL